MARTTSGRRNKGGTGHGSRRGSIDFGFMTRPEQNRFWLLIGFLLRRRAELTVITVVVIVHNQLTGWITLWLTPTPPPGAPPAPASEPWITPSQGGWIVMTATIAVVLVIPASRRYLIGRCWSVMTRHRMRACFAQTRTWTANGRMPFLVWSRPSRVGERVRVWLPAGLSVKDLERIVVELAAACWAREARITPIRGQAALVLVDVVRHDPLGSRRPVRPPILGDLHTTDGDDTGPIRIVDAPARLADPPMPRTGPTAPPAAPFPAPAPPAPVRAAVRKSATSTPAGAPADPPAVTGFGGMDVTDYV